VTEPVRDADKAARYSEVFASREYRALYVASALSWVGDYLAKAAVTALVFQQTRSVAAAAAAFAITFLPWVLGGPVLAAMAERYSNRSVLVTADLCRAILMCTIAIPGMPTAVLIALLFASSMFAPPFQAARSALLPRILAGDRLTLALAVTFTTMQGAQALGYLLGGALAAHYARMAILANALSFVMSALLIRVFIVQREPGVAPAARTGLFSETADGFRLVFSSRTLRGIVIVALTSIAFPVVPEGIAASWSATFSSEASTRGFIQGMIMVAAPLGALLCGITFNRLVAPPRRRRLAPVFALLTPMCLVPAAFSPPAWVVVALTAVTTFVFTGLFPTANAMFAQALPNAFRARASGVVQAGSQLVQGASVVAVGLIADVTSVPVAVGSWGLVGVGITAIACAWWPQASSFDRALAAATAINTGSSGPVPAAGDEPTPPPPAPATAGVPSAADEADEDTPTRSTRWRSGVAQPLPATGPRTSGRHGT
jgi:MFS family permease